MKNMMRFLCSGLLFCVFAQAYGQCCSAGNPVGGDGSGDGLGKNELRVQTSYRHSLSARYYHHDSKTDVPYIDRSYYDYQNLSLTYGILPRLSVHAELGYFFNKTQDLTIFDKQRSIRSRGLGDLLLQLRYMPVKTVKPVSQLVFAGAVRAPVGAFSEEMNGVTIPVALQPSSGAFKFSASAFYSRKRSASRFGWNSNVLVEISRTINKGFLVYRYGNYVQASAAGTFDITKAMTFIAGGKAEWRGRDLRDKLNRVESSGGLVLIFNPQLTYHFTYRWGVIVLADIPVYKYVNGYQLTNRFAVQVGLRKSFMFCRPVAKSDNTATAN
jgi:hypothetical protein